MLHEITKLLFVKDLHIRPNNIKQPVGRTDKYYEQIENKIIQIRDYAVKNDIKHILCAGDIFDIKARSRYTLDSILYIEKLLKLLTNNQSIELITIAGNHDMPNSSRQELDRSVYGYLSRQGYMKAVNSYAEDTAHISQVVTLMITDFELMNPSVKVYGIDYNSDIEMLKDEIENLNRFVDKNDFNILMLHEHLLPKQENIYASYMTYAEVCKLTPNFKVILAGHLHKGYPVYENKETGQVIINPWSFNRLARDYYAVSGEHIPEIVEVTVIYDDVKETQFVKHNTIPLQVEPFDKTFIKQQLSIERDYHKSITEFVSKIDEFKQLDNSYEKIPAKIKDKINYYLEMAERDIQE